MTENIIKCPACNSHEVHFRKTRGDWLCDICENIWTVSEKAEEAPKKRIFISYGRRDASDLALRLKYDLEMNGYDVWQDTEKIRAGAEWEKQIREGLRNTELFISILSPHAVRTSSDASNAADSDSVCLDEISFARFSRPATPIVPVMAIPCEPPFCIFRLDYVDMCKWEESEDEYLNGLRRLLEAVEDTLRGNVRYRWWEQQLKPWDFSSFLNEKRFEFCGRKWMGDIIEEWRKSPNERALLILGDPGIGKSALVADLVHKNPGDQILAYHCCQADTESTIQPARFVRNIAAMIASKIEQYALMLSNPVIAEALDEENCMKDPASSFEAGILSPLENVRAPEHGVRYIIVDGLNEALELKRGINIVDLLASRLSRLPSWLRVLFTSRRESAILDRLRGIRNLEINASDFWNMRDIEEYIDMRFSQTDMEARTSAQNVHVRTLRKSLIESCGGNFLYLKNAFVEIERGGTLAFDGEKIPEGLYSQYFSFFKRNFPNEQSYSAVRPLLETITASKVPLGEDALSRITGLSAADELPKILRGLSAYLPLRDGKFSVYHSSFAKWLTSPDMRGSLHYVNIACGHERLARFYFSEYEAGVSKMSPEALKYLPFHLAESSMRKELAQVLSDISFIEEKCFRGSVYELMRDYQGLAGGLEAAAEDGEGQAVQFSAFIKRYSHVFSRNPAAIFQYALNDPEFSMVSKAAAAYMASKDQKKPWLKLINPEHNSCQSAARFVHHEKGLNHCEYSRDGMYIVAGSDDGSVSVCDSNTGELIFKIDAHSSKITGCAFSPDGMSIATSAEWPDNLIKIWDFESREELFSLSGHDMGVTCCSFSPDGKRIVSASHDGIVKIWNFVTASEMLSFKAHSAGVNHCAFSPDGQFIATASADRTVKIFDSSAGGLLNSFSRHAAAALCCAFSPDGKSLVSASADRTARLWDIAGARETGALQNHSDAVSYCAFSLDGSHIITSSYDRVVRIFGFSDLKCVDEFYGHASRVTCCSFSPDKKTAISSSADHSVRVWNVTKSSSHRGPRVHSGSVECCVFSNDGHLLATASEDKSFKIWKVSSSREPAASVSNIVATRSCSFSPDGRHIAAGAEDGSVRIFELPALREARSFSRQDSPVEFCAYSPDGAHIAARMSDGSLRLLDAQSGKDICRFSSHTQDILCCSFSPDGALIVTASADRTVRIWDTKSGSEVSSFKGYAEAVKFCAFSPDGKAVATASADKSVKLRNVSSGLELCSFSGHAAAARICLFSPDGFYIASAAGVGDECELKLWDISGSAPVKNFSPGKGFIKSMSFCPDGRFIALRLDGGLLRILNIPSGEKVFEYFCEAEINNIMWHPGGRIISVCDAGGKFHLLSLENQPVSIPLVTPWLVAKNWWSRLSDSSGDERITFGCPCCRSWQVVLRSSAGKEILCPSCKGVIKLNQFLIEANFEAVSNAWNKK